MKTGDLLSRPFHIVSNRQIPFTQKVRSSREYAAEVGSHRKHAAHNAHPQSGTQPDTPCFVLEQKRSKKRKKGTPIGLDLRPANGCPLLGTRGQIYLIAAEPHRWRGSLLLLDCAAAAKPVIAITGSAASVGCLARRNIPDVGHDIFRQGTDIERLHVGIILVSQRRHHRLHIAKLAKCTARLQPLASMGEMQDFGAGLFDLDLITEIDTGKDRIVVDDDRHQSAIGVADPALVDGVHIQQVVGTFLARCIAISARQLIDQLNAELLAQRVLRQKPLILADQFNVEGIDPVGSGRRDLNRRGGDVVIRLRGAARQK